ncbi:hypothetical protein Pla123a_44680 [Posidoniimonas polymericola]|uniref:Uncharacterized protein n=1 Tax=Posidoniimonas polymericola TaxID=2528002 RepID=A0A5C5XWK1_9BACT|nr:hypothetical protein [Posidoniimonas polymericola]TWT67038.1 hypothetical protein Pla123a_44680 [Posidoniimonas polymericola]
MTKTHFSISAASRLTGKSRNTIAKHLKEGKLSCTDDGSGAKLIDASELARVYDIKVADLAREEGAAARPASQVQGPPADAEVQAMLAKEIEERERERRQFEQQIEHLQESLQLAQEGHNRATLLLESNQGAGGWQDAIASLEQKVANQESEAKQERERLKASAKRQIDHYKGQLEAEREKTIWQRILG